MQQSINIDKVALGNGLYGMQNMSSDSLVVRELLTAVLPALRECKEAAIAQEIGASFFGLQNMSSSVPEVRSVLAALAIRTRECKDDFGGQEIGNALFGMLGMSSDHAEVRSVLSALTVRIRQSQGDMRTLNVSNSLYGLQSMSADSPEVNDLLSALLKKAKSCPDAMKAEDVGHAVYGLQGMSGGPVFPLWLAHLYDQAMGIVVRSDEIKTISTISLMTLSQSIALGLGYLLESKESEGWSKIHGLLLEATARRLKAGDQYFDRRPQVNSDEMRIFSVAQKVFESSAVTVRHNAHIHSIFECDLLISLPLVAHPHEMIINIEVDGLMHSREKKKRFCVLRDKYFSTHNISVCRIESAPLRKMTNEDIREWVLDTVAQTILKSG